MGDYNKIKHQAGKVVLLFLFFCLFFSCKKDTPTDTLVIDPVDTVSTINTGDSIIIGNPINMIVKKYDDTLHTPYISSSKSYPFDVDNNGTNDFSFYLSVFHSSACGLIMNSSINCLNSSYLLNGFYTTDTFFLHKEINMVIDSTGPYYYNVTIKNIYTFHSISSNDSIVNILPYMFKISPRITGEYVIKNQSFKSDSIPLNTQACTFFPTIHVSNDTLYTIYNRNLSNQYSFPTGSIKYIGIKIIDSTGKPKLGWIKINAYPSSIIRFESAIQK